MKKFLRQEPVCSVGPKGHKHTIIRQFCKGCRICVEFCPTGTLDLDDRFKVKVAHPERCIACRMCEYRCPDMAIFVEKGASKDQPKSEAGSQMSEVRGAGADGAKREVGT